MHLHCRYITIIYLELSYIIISVYAHISIHTRTQIYKHTTHAKYTYMPI